MNATLAAEIIAMADEDQAMRRAAAEDRTAFAPRVDARNTARLKEIVRQFGWPTRSLVGDAAEHMAWLLAQHADRDPEFQASCLALMRAQPRDEVCVQHIAYLEDRVRLATGRKQLYGTQFRRAPDGELGPAPIEDADGVDERRAAAGLGPLGEYAEHVRTLERR